MTIAEQLAYFLDSEGFGAHLGALPDAPLRAAAVIAEDMRPEGDGEGALLRLAFRDAEHAGALRAAMRAAEMLSGFEGLFKIGGDYVTKVKIERGAALAALSADAPPVYDLLLRAWY